MVEFHIKHSNNAGNQTVINIYHASVNSRALHGNYTGKAKTFHQVTNFTRSGPGQQKSCPLEFCTGTVQNFCLSSTYPKIYEQHVILLFFFYILNEQFLIQNLFFLNLNNQWAWTSMQGSGKFYCKFSSYMCNHCWHLSHLDTLDCVTHA